MFRFLERFRYSASISLDANPLSDEVVSAGRKMLDRWRAVESFSLKSLIGVLWALVFSWYVFSDPDNLAARTLLEYWAVIFGVAVMLFIVATLAAGFVVYSTSILLAQFGPFSFCGSKLHSMGSHFDEIEEEQCQEVLEMADRSEFIRSYIAKVNLEGRKLIQKELWLIKARFIEEQKSVACKAIAML